MANLHDVAQLASDRIGAVVARARPVARGVALLSSACGGLAYLVGALVIRGTLRYVWLVLGLIVCAAPAIALWLAFRRLQRAAAIVPTIAPRLQALQNDSELRDALYELAENQADPVSTPLIKHGKDLLRLRAVSSKHREGLGDVFEAIVAVTSLPGLLALGIVGSFGLLILSVVMVVVGLAV